jgi:hypothetical protein
MEQRREATVCGNVRKTAWIRIWSLTKAYNHEEYYVLVG